MELACLAKLDPVAAAAPQYLADACEKGTSGASGHHSACDQSVPGTHANPNCSTLAGSGGPGIASNSNTKAEAYANVRGCPKTMAVSAAIPLRFSHPSGAACAVCDPQRALPLHRQHPLQHGDLQARVLDETPLAAALRTPDKRLTSSNA